MNEAGSMNEASSRFDVRRSKLNDRQPRTSNFEPRTFLTAAIASLILWAAPSLAAVAPQGQVEGEVIQVFSTMIVIKNEQGHATVLQLTPRTQLGAQFKPGDKVVAYVTPYGVTSVQPKASTAQIP
jgi:hypothetical protein